MLISAVRRLFAMRAVQRAPVRFLCSSQGSKPALVQQAARSTMAPSSPSAGVFHAGELDMQRRMGVSEQVAEYADFIRKTLPEQHRAFFNQQMNTLYIGGKDDSGRVWASVLVGEPGFLSSTGPTHLAIAPGSQLPSDPLRLAPGSQVGALGIDLATRRRNRVNGTIAAAGPDGTLHLHAEQSVGNCPKYIQTRHVRLDRARLAAMRRHAAAAPGPGAAEEGPVGEEQLALIHEADTFFLATSGSRSASASAVAAPGQPGAAAGGEQGHTGCDVSHRGGSPGFVEASSDGLLLRWPDFSGNNFMMSLGNLQVNPAAGLLFVDWMTGSVLQLTGAAEVDFDDRSMPGAQRTVRFRVSAWRYASAALPIQPAPVIERSPYNPRLPASGAAAGAAAQQRDGVAVQCVGVVQEAAGIKTFAFRAPPGLRYAPGQYATFDFGASAGGEGGPATPEPITRTWTLSSHPAETAADGVVTISVKKAGLVSSWLHDRLAPGMALQMRGTGGEFTARPGSKRPALLLAGGIGITPLRTIFMELVRLGTPAALLYSVRHAEEAAFLPELSALAAEASQAAAAAPCGAGGAACPAPYRVLATSTAPGSSWSGRTGRIDAGLVGEALGAIPPAACDVYICGPNGFMSAAAELVIALGADPAHIHTESFDF